uniref:Uncharacterized protein n=1 Tax=Rhizophagus irregularis (strain DAOM 181602 / DAOM 197198 / MUCL 43194) TaxID=747089 RepID=U9TU29_RHIID
MLLVMEKKSQPNSESEKIWESLQKALEANKRGVDGKVRILSIIAENFTYKKLNEKFGSKYSYAKFLPVDKNGSPILYMRDQKIKLWKKFEETFPNGMKKTSFLGRLANCNNIKYRNDMGGLCLTCNEYGYTPFESLIAIAHNTFSQKDQLNNALRKIDTLKRHLRRGYERELAVNADGTTQHNPCISHCLPYAFGKCLEKHKSRCSECDKFFEFFEFMHLHVMEDQQLL